MAFEKTVFDWEAHLLQKAVLDEELVDFKKMVFEWEAQLLQRVVLDEREVPSRRRCSTGRPSCFRGRC